MFVGVMFTPAPDWLAAVERDVHIRLTATAFHSARYQDGTVFRQRGEICLMLFVPKEILKYSKLGYIGLGYRPVGTGGCGGLSSPKILPTIMFLGVFKSVC